VDGFDALATTAAARTALERLREVSGAGGPMERHSLRCLQIAAEISRSRSWEIDSEILLIAAILHDIGLYPTVATTDAYTADAYTADGAALARRLLTEHGWPAPRVELCAATIDRHHELRRQLDRGPEVESLRLADLVDLTAGVFNAGLSRTWLRSLMRTVPRDGLAGELARQVGRAARQRPLTLPRIFLRNG
jgi:HD superfamily phosphodiesterase